MSVVNRFCNATKRTVKKVSDKAEELFDSTATLIKIKNLEAKIDEQYENLGRIVYRDLHTEESLEEEKLRVIAAIDALFDRLEELKITTEAPAEPEEKPVAEEKPTDEAPVVEEKAEEPAAEAAEPAPEEVKAEPAQ